MLGLDGKSGLGRRVHGQVHPPPARRPMVVVKQMVRGPDGEGRRGWNLKFTGLAQNSEGGPDF
jgi:hypothetical protein